VLDGTNLTFTLENPDPVDGDVFVWRLDPATDERLRPIEGDSFTIEGYAAGSTVCVEVSILRSGKTSSNPLRECYPA
jgi:hypothetical protein